MGIDKGNAAEQSIAKELYILNKKLDKLIDILDKRDVVLKIDNGGITMEPRKMRHHNGTAIEPIEDEKSGDMVPIWQHGKTVMVPIDQVKSEES